MSETFDPQETMQQLREGKVALTDTIIAALHEAGATKFLNNFYSGPYGAWQREQDRYAEDVGDRPEGAQMLQAPSDDAEIPEGGVEERDDDRPLQQMN